ncbi:MAG: cyanophycin synthetase, partial [bacterium]|nr:cyanophycin synthetase [bacterium]
GRLEFFHAFGRQWLLDGAHNPQKMQALVRTVGAWYPGKKIPCVVAMKSGKANTTTLRSLRDISGPVIATSFSGRADSVIQSAPPKTLAVILQRLGMHSVEIEPEIAQALERASAANNGTLPILVTGSLYLVGAMREMLRKEETVKKLVILGRSDSADPGIH